MKISRLLVLSTLWLCGLSAQAADLVERVAPEQPAVALYDEIALSEMTLTPAAYAEDQAFFLYNVGAGQYFCAGNDWETRASLSTSAPVVYFTATDAAKAIGENVVELKSYVPKFSEFRSAFAGGTDDFWTDNNSREDRFWTVTVVADNKIRISNAINEKDKFVGWKGAEDDTRLYLLAEAEGNAIDWQLFNVAEWTDYFVAQKVYAVSQDLKAIIETAEGYGINVSSAVAVYNNQGATVEQIEAAIAAVGEAIAEWAKNQASVSNPVVMTSSLVNPGFDDGTATGWSGTAPNMTGDGNHSAALVAEHYNKTFDTYQVLKDMPKGVYRFNAKTFFRGTYDDLLTGANKVAYVYAANGDTLRTYFNNAYKPLNTNSLVQAYGATTYFGTPNVEGSTTATDGTVYYIPNNPSTFRLYYEEEGKNWYDTNLFFDVADGNITLGVKKDQNVEGSTTDWAVFDSFGLTYYGGAAEAYQYWVDEMKKEIADFSMLEGGDVTYTEQYLTDFEATAAAATATNREEAIAAVKAIEEAAAPLTKNIDLWKQYKALVDRAMGIISNENLDQDRIDREYAVEEWAEFDAEDAINEKALTNEELQAEIEKWTAILDEVQTWFKAVDGGRIDQTTLLTNPDFTGNANGWTRTAASGGNVAWGSNCYEAWNNSSFDVYQVVKNAPEGVYEIEVQGFYRYLRGDNAWNAYVAQTESYVKPNGAPVYVYMNAKQTPFKNVFDEPVTESGFYSTQITTINGAGSEGENYYFPDGMISSNEAFTAGMYKQSAYGIIRAGQDMRIGVKGVSNQGGDSWVIWDNFKLYNVGKNAEALKNVLPDEVASAKELLNENMGKTIYENLKAAIATAEVALAGNDGEALFDALSKLFDAEENVNASIALFNELYNANEGLMDCIGQNAGTATATVQAAAGNLYEEISSKIAGHEIEDADVYNYLTEIKAMKTKLRLPVGYADASDLNPVEVPVIENASYDEGLESWDGTLAAYNSTAANAEIFNVNYDYYQDIYGLPAGTYQLTVQGFYRAGGAAEDYTSFVANPDSLNYAYYYGMILNGTDSVYSSKTLARLASGAEFFDADAPSDGYVWASQTDKMTVANTMVTAGDEFMNGKYINEPLTVKVGDDGYLRIGLKKSVNLANNWTIFDNWTLTYFGTASELVIDGDASQGIENVQLGEPVRTEFFTLDGRKANGLTKGIVVMKQTMGNGAVIVRKIRK